MNLQRTLTISIITLFLISFNAFSKEVPVEIKACNDAVNKGDASTALSLAEAILTKNSTNHEGLLCKGRAQGLNGKYEDALATLNTAVKSTENSFALTVSYILIGNLHKKFHQPEAAVASYKDSLGMCAKTGNHAYTHINYNLIGGVYTQAKDFNAALDSYKSSLSSAGNDNERAISFEQLATTYSALGNADKAIEYQVKTVVMQKQAGSLTAYADASLMLGKYFFEAGNYSYAERTYKKLAQFAKDNGGAYYEAKANFYLAETVFANGDEEEAKTLFSDANKLAKKIGAKGLVSEIDAAQKKLNI
ncbi:MAG: hypothetical protein COB34_05780 [Methylophilaceae bacterium]|nr:MAG: hypothetical protein COB34_05780 [Methylophilaceae bacterium]